MIRTITHRNGVNVNKQLVSSFNEEIKRLNAEDYNYTAINTAFLQLEAYLKQLATRLGIDISISWSISANGRAKLQLVNNNQRYNVQLRDLNQMFAGNFDAIAEFILQIETVYKIAANEFARVQSAYNSDTSAYADELSNLTNEYSELLADAEEADLTPEDITNIIAEADDATKGELSQVEQTIEDNLPTPPEGTIGSGVTGGKSTDELISDAQKAAEEAAQQAQERAEAEAGAKAAQEEADRAQAELDKANDAFEKANEAYVQATEDKVAARDEYDQATANHAAAESAASGASAATVMASNGTLPASGSGKSEAVTTTDYGTTVVTANTDGTYTVSNVSPDGKSSSTRTYDDASAFDKVEGGPSAAETKTATEAVHAQIEENKAEGKYNDASAKWDESLENKLDAQAKLEAAEKTAADAQAKADAAQQAADDANIPYASDDELENGWYNDDAEPEDTTEGNDDWGDWDGPSWGDGSVDME